MPASPRKQELLDRAYEYVLENGLTDLSLRPLAQAVGSSPRVLLYLFGSKDELTRALLRGNLLDLQATGDSGRCSAAVRQFARSAAQA